ncbi:MAG: hypothetical protein CL955_06985 [Erythrobacteraceae bacterium]|nr:hypothetical protein [Erythrobacteraceae bacterium]
MHNPHNPLRSAFALALFAPLALAACDESGSSGAADALSGSSEATPEAQETPDTVSLPVAESGWLTVGADGAVQTTFFDAGGRFRDLRNGEPFAQGKWEQRPDGKICFEPDEGAGACWTTAPPDDNGEVIATDEDGMAIALKRITYVAPPSDEEDGG